MIDRIAFGLIFAMSATMAAGQSPLLPDAKARVLAQCKADARTTYPGMTAANLASMCAESWSKVQASGPIAETILAAVPAAPGGKPTMAELKTRLPQVRWQAGNPRQPNGPAVMGKLGKFDVKVEGAPVARAISVGWSEASVPDLPYDVPLALVARGAKVVPLGCYHFGPSEVMRAYQVHMAGRLPFGLETYGRVAALGSQIAHLTVTADLSGKLPTLASLKAQHRDPAWEAKCPY